MTQPDDNDENPYAPPVKEEKPAYDGVFHPDFEALYDAIERLYIKGNQSGRIRFLEDWPEAARYILGPELNAFDSVGTGDPNLKEKFENRAALRRDTVIMLLEDVCDRVVKDGVLQVDYVHDLIDKLGPDMVPLIFSEKIIQKFVTSSDASALPPLSEPIHPKPKKEQLKQPAKKDAKKGEGQEKDVVVPIAEPSSSAERPTEQPKDGPEIRYRYDLSIVNKDLTVDAGAYALSQLNTIPKPFFRAGSRKDKLPGGPEE